MFKKLLTSLAIVAAAFIGTAHAQTKQAPAMPMNTFVQSVDYNANNRNCFAKGKVDRINKIGSYQTLIYINLHQVVTMEAAVDPGDDRNRILFYYMSNGTTYTFIERIDTIGHLLAGAQLCADPK